MVSAAGRTTLSVLAAALVLVALAWSAWRSDLALPAATVRYAVLDVGLGLLVAAAALLSRSPWTQRLWLYAVGALWLLASVVPVPTWHQAALLVCLAAFPTGRLVGRTRRVLLGAAVVIALGAPQVVVVVAFGALALVAGREAVVRRGDVVHGYAALAATAVATVLGVSWGLQFASTGLFDPRVGLVVYQGTVALVAVGHLAASWGTAYRSRARMAALVDDHLADSFHRRIAALDQVLGDALDDRQLRVLLWQPEFAAYVDAAGNRHPDLEDGWLAVRDDRRRLAAVSTRADLDRDAEARVAVERAVRLVASSIELQRQQEATLEQLQAARTRLVDVGDHQQARLARRLDEEVLPELRAAAAHLDAVSGSGPLAVAREELVASMAEIRALVRGVPPVRLGGGRLAGALAGLAGHAGIPVEVSCAPGTGAGAGAAAETTLFYVCAEALTNAAKHAGAHRVRVHLSGGPEGLALEVEDDGSGGADPSGSGLQRLGDRVASLGGTLSVTDRPGGGTRVRATVPRDPPVSRSGARA